MKSNQKLIIGTSAALAATTAIYSLAKISRNKDTRITLLVFNDGGSIHSKTNGLEPNAITLRIEPCGATLGFIRNQVAKALDIDMHKASSVRLFVQATKEEITEKGESNLTSILSDTHGLSAIALICTKDRADLSAEAAASVPLEHFPYPSHIRDLSIIGLGHKLAFKPGPHQPDMPLFNGFENLFRGRPEKTLNLFRPPYTDSTYTHEIYKDLPYHPLKEFGFLMSVDPDMVTEMLDRQEDFPKIWSLASEQKIQDYTGFGIFTNSTNVTSWETGHGVLPKFFNVLRIKNYYPIILEKTQSFVKTWTQLGNNVVIDDVQDWLTCMTADAVCKASMDLDMRNVERKGRREELHPFVKSFRYCVASTKTGPDSQEEYEKQLKIGKDCIEDVVERTRKGEIGGPLSFVTGMLENKASTNGEYIHFETFYGHCINIMIAGHETTAGTIAFTLCELSRHPECLAKCIKEIESVMGKRSSPTYEDVAKLEYIEACFRESLRLYAPVKSTRRDAAHDTIVKGNKVIRKGQKIEMMFWGMHRDPEQWDQGVFGDVDEYNPDRHLSSAPPRHANAYAYFGFGVRACIGMQFALLEAKTFFCMVLNFFRLETPPGYKVVPCVGSAFTAAPKEVHFTLKYREGGPLSRLNLFDPRRSSIKTPESKAAPEVVPEKHSSTGGGSGGAVLILYGSNTGTCEEFANLLAEKATEDHFEPEIMSLDEAVGKLPITDKPVLIVSSTYNGTPPDNAGKFHQWMTSLKEGSVEGMRFAVFGCGNSNWEATYQKFPSEIHSHLLAGGATQIKDIMKTDVSNSGFIEEFDEWATDIMDILGLDTGAPPAPKKASKKRVKYVMVGDGTKKNPLTDEITLRNAIHDALEQYAEKDSDDKNSFLPCEVTKATELQSEFSDRSTCHVEFKMPTEKMKYDAGDHLSVLSCNGGNIVSITMEVLGLKGDEVVECNPGYVVFSKKFPKDLPGIPLTSQLALEWLPDLTSSPTKKVLNRLAELCPCPPEAMQIKALADEKNYKQKVLDAKLTLPELLSKYRSIQIDIEELCACLPRLKPRYYSISSSPLVDPSRVSITVGLVEYDTKLGRHHKGVASGKINSLEVGSKLLCEVHKLNSNFRLPTDLSKPVIMVGPGTGVAPFMGFLEERDALIKKGKKLGPAHLFFGCRSSTTDFIYKERLDAYTKNGTLSSDGLHVAFSREEGTAKVYVQDLIGQTGEAMWNLIEKGGANVYICGDAKRMSPGVKKAFTDVAIQQGMSQSEADNWMGSMMTDHRYLEDVYA